jgi:hypothetical protein
MGYNYAGVLTRQGEEIVAQVTVTRHDKEYESVFGDIDEFEIVLRGSYADGLGKLNGRLPSVHNLAVNVELALRRS